MIHLKKYENFNKNILEEFIEDFLFYEVFVEGYGFRIITTSDKICHGYLDDDDFVDEDPYEYQMSKNKKYNFIDIGDFVFDIYVQKMFDYIVENDLKSINISWVKKMLDNNINYDYSKYPETYNKYEDYIESKELGIL